MYTEYISIFYQIRVNYTGEPNAHVLCHCLDCRKISGSSYSNNIVVPEGNFKLESGEPIPSLSINPSDSSQVNQRPSPRPQILASRSRPTSVATAALRLCVPATHSLVPLSLRLALWMTQSSQTRTSLRENCLLLRG